MFLRMLLVSLLFGSTSFGAELTLSGPDSGRLFRDTMFPHKSTEIIFEDGRELSLTVRELISEDGLLRFTCQTKSYAGDIVDISCEVFVDGNVGPLNGNERLSSVRVDGPLHAFTDKHLRAPVDNF